LNYCDLGGTWFDQSCLGLQGWFFLGATEAWVDWIQGRGSARYLLPLALSNSPIQTPSNTNRTSIAGIVIARTNMLLSRPANTAKGTRAARTKVKTTIKMIGDVLGLLFPEFVIFIPYLLSRMFSLGILGLNRTN